MGTAPTKHSKGDRPAHLASESAKFLQDDEALSGLMEKDPVHGQVMKIILGKLDETNKKLDETNEKLNSFHNELQGDLDTFQEQVSKIDALIKFIKDDKPSTMENIQALNAKMDCKRRRVVEDCLCLPTILRRILEQFSDKELIDLSLVNKLWNFEARSVLRDRGCLKAMIYLQPSCQSLVDFASDLRQMRVVPFGGILIRAQCSQGSCQLFSTGSMDDTYQVILDRLPWKHLSVEFPSILVGKVSQDCPSFVLVKKILENHSGVLQELFFSKLNENTEFIQTIIQGRSFPCLKTLTLKSCPDVALAKALVSCAPNLEKFIVGNPIQLMENVMEGSCAKLVAADGFEIGRSQVCESMIGALRTDTVFVHRSAGFGVELLNRFVPMVIKSSHTTLKALWMDLFFAVPLMCYRICMENVTDLRIIVNDTTVEGIQPNILALLKAFDFTRVFPKLNRVKVLNWPEQVFSQDDVNAFVEQANAVAMEALPDGAVNIRHLELIYGSTPPIIFFVQMFPNVKTLSVLTEELQEFPFTLLWEYFGCLAELYIEFYECSPPVLTNLDSVFCGIFPEEAAELRVKDDEYLKAVNIVPVMPSINCMKDLRTLTFLDSSDHCNDTSSVSTRIFSKVTGMIGFSRCPALSVEFQASPRPPGCTIL